MTHYRTAAGAYLGAFGAGVTPPPGAIAVPFPPGSAAATWNGVGWTEPAPEPRLVPLGLITFRLAAMGKLAAVAAVLEQEPEALGTLLGLREGIYANDAQASALLAAAGADPLVILAP